MPQPAHLDAISAELDTLGDLAIEQSAQTAEILAIVTEMRGLLVRALTDVQEIPELRRRIVDVEMRLDAAE